MLVQDRNRLVVAQAISVLAGVGHCVECVADSHDTGVVENRVADQSIGVPATVHPFVEAAHTRQGSAVRITRSRVMRSFASRSATNRWTTGSRSIECAQRVGHQHRGEHLAHTAGAATSSADDRPGMREVSKVVFGSVVQPHGGTQRKQVLAPDEVHHRVRNANAPVRGRIVRHTRGSVYGDAAHDELRAIQRTEGAFVA